MNALVYGELRSIAEQFMRNERRGHTLQPTAVVHEAYLRLGDQQDWQSRAHFFASAAKAIRRVLVDHARRRGAAKRVGERVRVGFDDGQSSAEPWDTDLLELDRALRELSKVDARQARIVELRFFGGLSVAETAELLGVSDRTVEGDWRMARAWLHRALSK